MAQAMASMAGLRGSSQVVLEGSLGGSARLNGAVGGRPATARQVIPVVKASAEPEEAAAAQSGRRAVLGLVAAGLAGGSFVKAVLAEPKPLKLGPPPPPSGGLPGTLNSDEPRDLDLPLKNRFFIQPLTPEAAAQRAKESVKDILGVKPLIDKKAWPYVMNDLRLKAEYLRYDLNTVIASKSKEEKKALKQQIDALFNKISDLDHAAKIKSTPQAEKYYAETKSALDGLLSKLG